MINVEISYFKNGDVYVKRPKLNGKLHGTREEYYLGGNIESTIEYRYGKMRGLRKHYTFTKRLEFVSTLFPTLSSFNAVQNGVDIDFSY